MVPNPHQDQIVRCGVLHADAAVVATPAIASGHEAMPPLRPTAAGQPSDLYPPLRAPPRMVRIGLLLDSEDAPAWIAHIVEQIQASGFAQVAFCVLNGAQRIRQPLRTRLRDGLRHLLYRQYQRIDSALRRGPDSAFRVRQLRPLLQDAHWLTVDPQRHGHVDRIASDDLARIRAMQPDLLLRFGFNILRGAILDVAPHGVWSYHHGDSGKYRGGPAMFWEIQQDNPLTGTVLQRLDQRLDAGHVLYRSYACTNPHSLELNRNAAYWKASSFVMRSLRALVAGTLPQPVAARTADAPLYHTPGNARMVQFLARIAVRKSCSVLDNQLRLPHWFVAWRHRAEPLDPAAPEFADAHELACPRGHFYADPLLHRHRGQTWLFVEDFDYRRHKGTIAAIPWGRHGPDGAAQTALDVPGVHLSYPFVFDWRGDTYLIPESVAAARVSLFRARSYPNRWEFVCDLLQGRRVVDTTLHEHLGRWYLFANVSEAGGSTWDELFLFHADTPLGPFLPHPCNPVVSDVRRARPAGRLFRHAGRLIRPAQDCARNYGRALVFNEVLELDRTHFQERDIGRLAPHWAPHLSGCHTYNALDGVEVVDGKRPAWRYVAGAPRQRWAKGV